MDNLAMVMAASLLLVGMTATLPASAQSSGYENVAQAINASSEEEFSWAQNATELLDNYHYEWGSGSMSRDDNYLVIKNGMFYNGFWQHGVIDLEAGIWIEWSAYKEYKEMSLGTASSL